LTNIFGIGSYVLFVPEPPLVWEVTAPTQYAMVVGLDGQMWANSMEEYAESMTELMKFSRNKKYYQQGLRAARLIRSAT
jgi:hypothetical protein